MRPRRLMAALCVAVGAWALGGPAGASGDFGCYPGWTLDKGEPDCASGIVLSPGNDTRVNLALLLRDRAGAAGEPGGYPELEWDYGYAHSFFDWQLFRRTFFRPEAPAGASDYYSGSRCVSLKGGDAAFVAAVAAAKGLSQAEREALVAARAQLAPICESFGRDYWLRREHPASAPAPAWPVNVQGKAARDFAAYLVAAAAFYGEDWGAARSGFAGLSSAGDPWLKETARYMLARVDLNAAQANSFDEWGSFKGPEASDSTAVAEAGRGLADYLRTWPDGRYAASARGLQRRVAWLGGNLGGLADIYEGMLQQAAPASEAQARLVEEIDNKLLLAKGAETAIDTPLLLATYDLMRMRGNGDYGPPPIDEAELARQERLFAGQKPLYDFVRATYAFYVGGDAQGVLSRIPDGSSAKSYSALEFSRQVLRGQALAALGDAGEEAFWTRLIPGATGLYQRPAAELGLALHYQRGGRIGKVFAAGSPIENSAIRKILLERMADAAILRAEARNAARPAAERDLALLTLLYKQLSRGQYAGFLGDLALVPAKADTQAGLWDLAWQDAVPVGLFTAGRWSEGYACPALRETAAGLSRNPADVKGRLCLGEFYRLNGFDDFYLDLEGPAAGELGGGKELFAGAPTPRAAFYDSIIADPKAARADKAYALYRAVMCYAPSGNNTCGGEDAPEARRKAWFQTLKRQYADTQWARELKYYW